MNLFSGKYINITLNTLYTQFIGPIGRRVERNSCTTSTLNVKRDNPIDWIFHRKDINWETWTISVPYLSNFDVSKIK